MHVQATIDLPSGWVTTFTVSPQAASATLSAARNCNHASRVVNVHAVGMKLHIGSISHKPSAFIAEQPVAAASQLQCSRGHRHTPLRFVLRQKRSAQPICARNTSGSEFEDSDTHDALEDVEADGDSQYQQEDKTHSSAWQVSVSASLLGHQQPDARDCTCTGLTLQHLQVHCAYRTSKSVSVSTRPNQALHSLHDQAQSLLLL